MILVISSLVRLRVSGFFGSLFMMPGSFGSKAGINPGTPAVGWYF